MRDDQPVELEEIRDRRVSRSCLLLLTLAIAAGILVAVLARGMLPVPDCVQVTSVSRKIVDSIYQCQQDFLDIRIANVLVR